MIDRAFIARSLAVVGTAMLARAFFIAFAPFVAGDASEYERIALNLLGGNGFALHPSTPTVFRPPAYPLLIAAVYGVAGAAPGFVLAVQAGLGAVGAWCVYLLGRRLLSERTALAGGLLAAAYPHLAFYAATLLSETLSFALLALAMLAVSHALPELRRVWPLAIAGAAFAGAALSSPRLAPMPAAIPLVLATTRAAGRRWLVACALLAAGYAVVLAPWVARNAVVFGVPAPLTIGQSGLNLWLSAYRISPYDYRLGEFARTEPLVARWLELYDGPPALRERDVIRERLALEEELSADAWRRIAADPVGYVAYRARVMPGLWVQPAIYAGMFRAPLTDQNDQLAVMLAKGHWAAAALRAGSIVVFTFGLFAGTALGVWALRRRGQALLLLLAPALVVAAVHTLLLAEQRYSVLAHPFLWLVAAAGWGWALAGLRRRIYRTRSSQEYGISGESNGTRNSSPPS